MTRDQLAFKIAAVSPGIGLITLFFMLPGFSSLVAMMLLIWLAYSPISVVACFMSSEDSREMIVTLAALGGAGLLTMWLGLGDARFLSALGAF